MIQENIKAQIINIWEKYIADNKPIQDTKGKELHNIDENRLEAITTLRIIIDDFLIDKIDIAEFKTDIDSFNKQNNFWGFTSIKGQMFFNLLLKTIETKEQGSRLTKLLKECISEPQNLTDALSKIEKLDKYVRTIFDDAGDRRKAPNPGSICYFLSYFWQIHNYQLWPVMYSSMIVSFTDIGLWNEPTTKKGAYELFYNLNEEVKKLLSGHAGRQIDNWEAEHAFWNFRAVTAYPKPPIKAKDIMMLEVPKTEPISALKEASFNIYTYLPPVIANLIELGNETEGSGSVKGVKFEKAVCEIFKQLGFKIQSLGGEYHETDPPFIMEADPGFIIEIDPPLIM